MPPHSIPGPREGLQLIDVVGVAVYLVITAAIVVWSSRRQANTDDFFLGGRRMPWMAVGLSLLATLMSSISYMGLPGEMISNGITMFAQYLSLPFSMLVVLGVWVPFFMRLRLTSAYEYLEKRFDYRVRFMGGLLFLLLRFGWMSMVMYVGSLALTEMTASLFPTDRLDPVARWLAGDAGTTVTLHSTLLYWMIGTVGILATIYTCAGGIRAAIWNDVLQALMLLGGTLVTLGYVMWTTGTGPSDWWATASRHAAGHTHPKLFSFDVTERMTIFTAVCLSFFWTVCTHGSDQVALQRYFSTTSLSSARRSYIVNTITDLTIGLLLAMCGLALLAFYLDHPTFLPEGIMTFSDGHVVINGGDRILPYFFAHQLPAGIGGVILAVLLCDAMQTLVSGVNSISAVFTTDVFRKRDANAQNKLSALRLARGMTVVVGLIVTALSLAVAYEVQHSKKNIVDMMAPAFNMFLGPLASLFLIGMFLSCKTRTVLFAATCSLVISFVWSYWKTLFDTPWEPSITLSTAVPYLAGFVIAAIVSFVFNDKAGDLGRDYMWRAVMRRPVPEPTDEPLGK